MRFRNEKHKDTFQKHFEEKFEEEFPIFLSAIDSDPITSIRFNRDKLVTDFPHQLDAPVPWCENAFYLNKRPIFKRDPLLYSGCYYVQDASSMFFANAIDFNRPMVALDLCAAPGGKSTLLLDNLTADSLLISNEINFERNKVLVENLNRWGKPNVVVTQNAIQDFARLGVKADLLLVDAPCSGEGMFRKDEDSINQWSEKLIESCSIIQSDILDHCGQIVSEQGYMVYSTCTFEKSENENQIIRFLENNPQFESIKINLDPKWQIDEVEFMVQDKVVNAYYLYFHKVKGEGQFVCVLQNMEEANLDSNLNVKAQKRRQQEVFGEIKGLDSYIYNSNYQLIELRNRIHAVPDKYVGLLQKLTNLNLWKLGVHVGAFKNESFIPSHELALSNLVNPDLPSLNVDYNQAVNYLLKNELTGIQSTDNGWFLLKYNGIGIGWVKSVNGRFNNHLPIKLKMK